MKMKNTIFQLALLLLVFSCTNDETSNNPTPEVNVTFNFSHNWDGTAVFKLLFNNIQFTNANGDQLSITKLRYLVSKITLQKTNGELITVNEYNLVDVTNGTNSSFTPSTKIPVGNYSKVSFNFGFDNDFNSGNYPDLNSVSWNVPQILGGGYHFMQLEGKFIDDNLNETGYAYHTIRAVDNSGADQILQDTSFEVNLGPVNITDNISFNIAMNIAEWFKNPNTWNLNELNNALMPNFGAQIMMFENGQSVFSLQSTIQ